MSNTVEHEHYASLSPKEKETGITRKEAFTRLLKEEYYTRQVVGIALEYLVAKGRCSLDNIDRSLYQVRCVFTDAFRDAGCDDEQALKWIFGWGSDISREIIKVAKAKKLPPFDEETNGS